MSNIKLKWYEKQIVHEGDVIRFLNKLSTEIALSAKITFDRDSSNDYCETWYHIFYYAEREY
jgi:hypothetical protein